MLQVLLLMLKKFTAEFTGTFLLVFCGTGAIIIDETSGGAITHAGVAASFGLAVFALVMTFGKISGAHINPAVTITQLVRKKISRTETGVYLSAQFTAAACSSASLHFLFPKNELLGTTLPSGSELQSFIFEFLLTFILLLAIIRTTEEHFSLPVVAIVAGGIVGLEALFAGPVCGASMNPARSFGPAFISGHYEHLWIYFIAPISGALSAAGIERIFFKPAQHQS